MMVAVYCILKRRHCGESIRCNVMDPEGHEDYETGIPHDTKLENYENPGWRVTVPGDSRNGPLTRTLSRNNIATALRHKPFAEVLLKLADTENREPPRCDGRYNDSGMGGVIMEQLGNICSLNHLIVNEHIGFERAVEMWMMRDKQLAKDISTGKISGSKAEILERLLIACYCNLETKYGKEARASSHCDYGLATEDTRNDPTRHPDYGPATEDSMNKYGTQPRRRGNRFTTAAKRVYQLTHAAVVTPCGIRQ